MEFNQARGHAHALIFINRAALCQASSWCSYLWYHLCLRILVDFYCYTIKSILINYTKFFTELPQHIPSHCEDGVGLLLTKVCCYNGLGLKIPQTYTHFSLQQWNKVHKDFDKIDFMLYWIMCYTTICWSLLTSCGTLSRSSWLTAWQFGDIRNHSAEGLQWKVYGNFTAK